MFKKGPYINAPLNTKPACSDAGSTCSDVGGGCCDLIASFEYDENTYLLTLTTTYGGHVFTVDLSSLAPDGVVNSVIYDPVTGILTVTTTAPATYQVNIGAEAVANTVFVMANGSDATGQRERFDLPFATPWAAVAAAVAGDTVIIYPGNYTTANLENIVKDGVKIHMYSGAVMSFTSTSLSNRPLADNGVQANFVVTGNGRINIGNTANAALNQMMSNSASTYDITLDTLDHLGYLHSSAGESLRLVVKTLISPSNQSIVWRNTIAAPSKSYIRVENLIGSGAFFSTFDHRNFTAAGSIDIEIGYHLVDLAFQFTGYYYFNTVTCPIRVKSKIRQRGNLHPNGRKPICVFDLCAPAYDIDIDVNHVGNAMQFQGFAAGGATSSGIVRLRGYIQAPTTALVLQMHNFNVGSRVTIDYNLHLVDNINDRHFLMTNVPTTVHFTGRLRYQTTMPAATSAPFEYNNPIGTPTATLRNLVVETDTDYLYKGNGPVQLDIPCIGVYSNKGLNPVLHAAVIEPITVSPSVTA